MRRRGTRTVVLSTALPAVLVLGGCTSPDPAPGPDPTASSPAQTSPPAASSPAPTNDPPPSPEPPEHVGASGIGDAYFPYHGNGGYDVRHYDIAVEWSPRRQRLDGDTSIRAVATQRLRRFNLDLLLTGSTVRVNGRRASTEQHGRELIITPAEPIPARSPFTVQVSYGGRPGDVSTGSGQSPWYLTGDGAVVVGEPESAAVWFPCNDHPRDKATFDISATVPRRLDVVSNGRPAGTTAAPSGRATTRWRVTSPMATYLAYLALGDFTFERGRTDGGVPYLYAISEHLGKVRRPAVQSLRESAEVLDVFEKAFGPYPFDIAGGTLANVDFGFALENQTRPVYSRVFFDKPNTEVIAHELAHQWFGNSVSLHSWRDIWLNEGLATWASWYYAAHDRQPDRRTPNRLLDLRLDRLYEKALTVAGDDFWEVSIGDPGSEAIFAAPVYVRGALAVQALRNVIGPAVHDRLLRTWASRHRDGNASIDDFIALAERISAEELSRFFRVWLFATRPPAGRKVNGLVSPWGFPSWYG